MFLNVRQCQVKTVITQYKDELTFDHFMEKLVQSAVHPQLNNGTHQRPGDNWHHQVVKTGNYKRLRAKTTVYHNLNK